MPLKVIGAGFGRTGTESLKAALEMLGFGPCYHMFEVIPHAERVAMWRGIMKGDTPDWDHVFADYNSTVDWPTTHFWRELAARYPEAKIVLSVRDGEGWYRSMQNSIFKVVEADDDPDSLGMQLMTQVFDGRHLDRDHAISVFDDHIATVQAAFGPDRLLTYELGAGWGPLCEFLGVDEPAEDYPHSNTSAGFQDRVRARSANKDGPVT